jgi:3-oxoacyl-[acyl-carrier protein] reductase
VNRRPPFSLVEHLSGITPLHRLGTPDEVARTVAYIVESDFMTGAVVSVDGGLTSGY